MKRMLAGVLVALPLFITAMPKQASALVISLGGHHHQRWISGHWERIHHRDVWIRGHYERY
ncbi:hypothetical protein [Nostoc sp.]|uniref:hypothetical protein n=1 Tax=Nostoc sp. TaxID=1180 RepID=UPI002FFB1630